MLQYITMLDMSEFGNISLRRKMEIAAAATQRQRLLEESKLSVASGLGQLVITVSNRVMRDEEDPHVFYHALMTEAERVEEVWSRGYQSAVIRPRATREGLTRDFANPEVAGMIFIGNGSINRLFIDGGDDYNWLNVARATTHLKRGKIVQMMCGHFPTAVGYCVPFGTFAVSTLPNLSAATGKWLDTPAGEIREHLFAPVFPNTADETATGVLAQLDALNVEYGRAPLFTE